MNLLRRVLFIGAGAGVLLGGCERKTAGPATAPATRASTKATSTPKELTYVDVIRAAYPKVTTTQPLGVPVDLGDAGRYVLDDPIYLCPRGDLWITKADAPATEQAVWKADDEQIHLLREAVVFALWATDDDGKWFPRPVVRTSGGGGGGGGYEWVDREGRRATTAGRAYRWDDAMILNEGVAVPTDRGVAIFSFTPEYRESYHELPALPADANPPQLVMDARGLIAWSPWDGTRPGGAGVARFVDGKWTDVAPNEQWPAKILHLVPLLDGTVLQLHREALQGPVKLAMSVVDSVGVDEKVIAELVEQLSHDEPEKRQAAYAELTRYGNASWPILEKLLPDQPPEAQVRMEELLRNRIEPTLGGRKPVDGVMRVADRFRDGGIVLHLPAGVRVPHPSDPNAPPRTVKNAWISIRPGRAIELLDGVVVGELPPEKQDLFAFGDEWCVSDGVQPPRRLYGNHLEPMLKKEEAAFAHVVGFDRRGRWLFRKSRDAASPTMLLDPTLPDPTPKLPVWLLPVAKGMVGWTKKDYPAVKGSSNLVRNLDVWALYESGWRAVNPKDDTLITELPKGGAGAVAPAAGGAAAAPPLAASRPNLGPPILVDKDGRTYFDGKESLVIVEKSAKETTWKLPGNAAGKGIGTDAKVWLVRTDDGLLFLFNEAGRVVRIAPSPGEAEPFKIEMVFTNRVPNSPNVQRIWLDPAGRIAVMYEKNKLAILFPSGRVPKDIATMIPAKELE